VHRAIYILIFCGLAVGCRRSAPPDSTNPNAVRCVFVGNHTDRPLVFELRVNGATAERVVLASHQKLFLYEPLPERVRYSSLEPTHGSIASADGSRMAYTGFAMELQAVLATNGAVTAQGSCSGESNYSVPTQDWLEQEHLTARLVQNLRRVDAKILSSENQ